ncbi:hypothetical protein H6F89_31165 [Cyanobacteria bacterium FACHB-63]|nr:hypothetical protein [Cyanobacteria bacterium FACHB-63]
MLETGVSNQSVWGLYEKYLGDFGKLVGLFSSVDRAKECRLIQPLLQESWRYLDIGRGYVIWQANAIDPLHPNDPFHFSIGEIEIDRLVESSESDR